MKKRAISVILYDAKNPRFSKIVSHKIICGLPS
jgi:hypothetical protein